MSAAPRIRPATVGDAAAIARIHAEGIAERVATFETRPPSPEDVERLVGKIFDSNAPSLELVRACGWREVGVHLRHGRLDGQWKDVVVVERLLGEAAS